MLHKYCVDFNVGIIYFIRPAKTHAAERSEESFFNQVFWCMFVSALMLILFLKCLLVLTLPFVFLFIKTKRLHLYTRLFFVCTK